MKGSGQAGSSGMLGPGQEEVKADGRQGGREGEPPCGDRAFTEHLLCAQACAGNTVAPALPSQGSGRVRSVTRE